MPHQSIRLAANRNNSTEPDVIAVTVILTRPLIALENTQLARSMGRNDFSFRLFFVAMVFLVSGQAAVQPDPDAIRLIPIVERASGYRMSRSMKCLNGVVNQNLPSGMVYD